MEATNPRASMPEAWAPPPPVVSAPMPPEELSGEDAFDAVIGNLVEQFNSLPPPAYGEPPSELDQPVNAAMAALPETHALRPAARKRNASNRGGTLVLATALSMLFGGGVTMLLMVGPQRVWQRITGTSQAATTEAPKVVVTFEKPAPLAKVANGPKAEPLDPQPTPAAAPAPALVSEAAAAVAPPRADTTTARPATKKASIATKTSRRAHRAKKRRKAATSVKPIAKKATPKVKKGASDWEDPYK